MEAGPPLLSWNKYMHDTSSLLVMSAFFLLFCSYIHKRGVGYIYGSGLFVCMRVWYPFLFLVIGGVCFMLIPTWEQFFDGFFFFFFFFFHFSSQSLFRWKGKQQDIFFLLHSSVRSIKVCNQNLFFHFYFHLIRLPCVGRFSFCFLVGNNTRRRL